jgi:hypothetical protein
MRGYHRMTGANPPTPEARLTTKHGIRAPRRTVVELRVDEYGSTDAIFSCGHGATGRGRNHLGFKGPCYSCQIEMAYAAEQAERERRTG